MSSYKTDSGIDDCRKNIEGACEEGSGGGSGITSINGDTTTAQTIVGGTNINVSSVGGTSTISAVGSAAGTVTGMTAPQMFTSPVNETVGGVLELVYNGTPMALTSTSNGLLESTQENTSNAASAEAGFAGKNDQGDLMEVVMSGSGNTRRGIVRSASSAFGLDINQQGSGKNIRLITNGTARATVDDAGLNAVIGASTPASGAFTTVTASTPIAVSSGGIGTNSLTAHYILAGAGASTPALINPSTSGYVLTSTGASSDPTFQAVPGGVTLPVVVSDGGTGRTSLTAHNVLVGEGTSVVGSIDPSTVGYVLTSNGASSDPTFQAAAGVGINQVVMQATSTSVQSITDNTATKVTNWSANIDTATGFASNTYTIPYAGYYKVEATLIFTSDDGAFDGQVYVYQNGSATITGYDFHQAVTGNMTIMVQGVLNCAASDTVDIYIKQNVGASLALLGTGANTNWSVTSVGGQNAGGGGSGTVSSVSASSSMTGVAVGVTNPTTTPAIAFSYSGTPFLVANGGTGVTTSTGSGNVVLSNSPALVTPALGTPASGVMTNVTGIAANFTAGLAVSLSAGGSATIVYQSASGVTAFLTNGSAGQVLTCNGGTTAPSWGTAGTNVLTTNNTWTGTNLFQNTTTISGTTFTLVGASFMTVAGTTIVSFGSGTELKVLSGGVVNLNSGSYTTVEGTADFYGPFRLSGSAGSVGQVLQSNGTGTAPTWVSQLNIFATNNTWTGTNTWQNTNTNNGSNIMNGTTTLTNQLIANGSAGTAGQFLVSQG